MKVKAIKHGEGYILLSKENLKKGDLYLKDGFIEEAKVDKEVPSKDYIKLIGSETRYLYPVPPFVAPWSIDIEKQVDDYSRDEGIERTSFEAGLRKGIELSNKKFDLDDIKKAIEMASTVEWDVVFPHYSTPDILKFFTKSKEYLLDIKMEYRDLLGHWYPYVDSLGEHDKEDFYLSRLRPKLDDSCKIIIDSYTVIE